MRRATESRATKRRWPARGSRAAKAGGTTALPIVIKFAHRFGSVRDVHSWWVLRPDGPESAAWTDWPKTSKVSSKKPSAILWLDIDGAHFALALERVMNGWTRPILRLDLRHDRSRARKPMVHRLL